MSLGSPDPAHVDPELEAILPARIGDTKLIRISVAGSGFVGGGDVCSFVCPEEPRLMAESVGKTRDDLTVAVAYDEDDGIVGRFVVTAFRVRGVTGAQLRDGRISMYEPDGAFPIIGDEQVAGRTVTVAVTWWAPSTTEYMVATDEALIMIRAPSPENTTGEISVPDLVVTIVEALP